MNDAVAIQPIPLREIAPYAMFSGTSVHEFVHEGRHLLGFPCH